jgi:hypothetical protein
LPIVRVVIRTADMQLLTSSLLGLIALISTSALAAELKFTVAANYFEKKPDGKSLGPCHGGAVIDKAGNIYITTDTARGIVVFSADGKYQRAVSVVM